MLLLKTVLWLCHVPSFMRSSRRGMVASLPCGQCSVICMDSGLMVTESNWTIPAGTSNEGLPMPLSPMVRVRLSTGVTGTVKVLLRSIKPSRRLTLSIGAPAELKVVLRRHAREDSVRSSRSSL